MPRVSNERDEQETGKRRAAETAVRQVQSGMTVGLGTGSTAEIVIDLLAKRVQQGLDIQCVPTSKRSEFVARTTGLPLVDLLPDTAIDLTIDGADEIDPDTLHVLKGRGGALLREKLVAVASDRLVIVADRSKLVNRLGGNARLPVEVVPFGWSVPAKAIERLGGQPELRMLPTGSAPYVSDNGNYILDVAFEPIDDPVDLGARIKAIIGVVEHGLFTGLVTSVLIGDSHGVEERPQNG